MLLHRNFSSDTLAYAGMLLLSMLLLRLLLLLLLFPTYLKSDKYYTPNLENMCIKKYSLCILMQVSLDRCES